MQNDFAQKWKDLNQFQITNPFFVNGLQILSNPLKNGFKSFKSNPKGFDPNPAKFPLNGRH